VQVLNAYMDNRGSAFVTVTQPLDKTTLSRKTAAIYVAGADNVLGTADDVRMFTTVGYRKGRLTMSAATALNQPYRVKLNSAVIKDVNGLALDGEFAYEGRASGNGVQGGNFDVIANFTSSKYRARFSTVEGYINVALTKNTPLTMANFFHYSNEGAWDGTIFHRSVRKGPQSSIDIVQAGGYKVGAADNKVHQTHEESQGVNLEVHNLHTRGTIAMARAAALDSGTNQWFFNVLDNPFLDAAPGYTVFGQATDPESLATLDALAKLPTGRVNNFTPDRDPLRDYLGMPFDDVPVLDEAAINARGTLSPKDDYPSVTRVAMLFNLTATPGTGVSRSLATTAAPAIVAVPPASATPFATTKSKDSLFDDAAE
jgi:peptidyl-prolyl cis-trans isomerase A (cyclophilin A)